MRLFSPDLERRALRTLLSSKAGAKLWGAVTAEHFVAEVSQKAFKRIELIYRKKGELPTWSGLIGDPALDDETRSSLRAFKQPASKTPRNITALAESLEAYRKKRALNALNRLIGEKLSADGSEIDDVMLDVAKAFSNIGQGGNDLRLHTIGRGDTAEALVRKVLKGEEQRFMPTGFKTFDNESYGIPLGSFFLIAGASGTGKSAILNQLATNFAMIGAKVQFEPLEMASEDMLQRTLASITGMSLTKFLNPKKAMTTKEKLASLTAYKRLSARIRKAGGRIMFREQSNAVAIEQVLSFAKAQGNNIVIIDYVGLLAGTDGEDQWRQISNIGKVCKRWAAKNQTIVVMAAQLSEEGKVRYARALKEDASSMWSFVRTPQDRANNTTTIIQEKGRQQAAYNFQLYMDLATQTIRDLTPDERKAAQAAAKKNEGKGGPASAKAGKAKRFFADV